MLVRGGYLRRRTQDRRREAGKIGRKPEALKPTLELSFIPSYDREIEYSHTRGRSQADDIAPRALPGDDAAGAGAGSRAADRAGVRANR
jgi:hypothetical protein